MKVAILVNEINICGGTHKQVLRLVDYLKREKVDFQILTRYYNDEKTYKEFKNFKIDYLKKDFKTINFKFKILNKIINKYIDLIEQIKLFNKMDKDVNVVNVHDNNLSIVIFLSKIFRKKIVWQINDLPGCFLEGNAKRLKDSTRFKIKRMYYKWIINWVDIITVNVTKNKERVRKHFNRDAKVFYCGTDIDESWKQHNKILDKKHVCLISTGVFFPYRNYETLIQVVECLLKKDIDCCLNIIGSTELNKKYTLKIKDLIKNKKLEKHIFILGQLNEVDFNKIYDGSDIFLFVNIDQSWGLAVFEAMARGLPVVVSESVGAVELLKDKENAFIVNPVDVEEITNVIEFLKDDKIYQKISENAINSVKNFTWDKLYSSKMLNIFNEIVKKE